MYIYCSTVAMVVEERTRHIGYAIPIFSRYSDSLQAGRSGDRIPVGARFSEPLHSGPAPTPKPPIQYRLIPGGKAAEAWR